MLFVLILVILRLRERLMSDCIDFSDFKVESDVNEERVRVFFFFHFSHK